MAEPEQASLTPPRRLAYADPPYPGQAKKRYGGTEVNHALLVEHLRTFDGWALSTSASALRDVWNLCPEARCAAWLKPNARGAWSRVRWSWEPVLFVTDRRGIKPGEVPKVDDGLVCAATMSNWQEVPGKGGGSKPYLFVRWIMELLDVDDGDELVDLFPGSGAVSRAVAMQIQELPLSADPMGG